MDAGHCHRVARVSVCWSPDVLCKMAQRCRYAVGGLWGQLTYVGPKNHALDEGIDRTNPFAAAMWPFAKLLSSLVFIFLPFSIRRRIFPT